MIKIEKNLSLDFLGQDYIDSYVILNAIPVKEYKDLLVKIDGLKDGDSVSNFEFIVSLIRDRFISGKIKQGGKEIDITESDLEDMPGEFFLGLMERLVGNNPKA